MDVLSAIFSCFPSGGRPSDITVVCNQMAFTEKDAQLADDIVDILFEAEKPGQALQHQLKGVVHPEGWYKGLAKRILHGVENALNRGKPMGHAMKKAFDRASAAANEFVQEHPVFAAAIVTVAAIGILVLLVPWVVEALGFAELGPVEGSFAAWWQSTFPDAEAGSFFSYLQKLGMRWGET
ncbi:hypothetical protein LTR37_001171 [Vermiconidia calcicola]|uniref:Uncharacterized protein n=1 Tax=Vermiconidia calcicola TaxID=1690605 RepID=A0ACC3NVQ9_9PEZI|nr:hypothetical protein LTR37_001171 [Vermiconidia calcicola]